jgi:hypothetical protein
MDSNKLNDWLQLVGLFGVIASLVFVGVQVRQTQVIAEGESAMLSIEPTVAARQLLIDNIDTWIKGCAGEKMSAAEEAKFAQLHRAYTQIAYFAWLTARHNILDFNPDDFVFVVAANIHRYPGFAQASASLQEWAKQGMELSLESGLQFRTSVVARVAELQEIEPEPNYDVKYCGM